MPLQVDDSTVAWKTLKQSSVALSTAEAEFVSLSEGTKLVVWMRCLLKELNCEQQDTVVREDNQGAVLWSSEGIRHAKHVSIRRNFVKEHVYSGKIRIQYFPTSEMVAHIFTKPLLWVKFDNHRESLGLMPCQVAQVARGVFEQS